MRLLTILKYAEIFWKFCSDFRSGTAGFLYADGRYVDLESRGFIVHRQVAQYDALEAIGFWKILEQIGWPGRKDGVQDINDLGVKLQEDPAWNPVWLRVLLKKLNVTRQQLSDTIDTDVWQYCEDHNAIRIWIYDNILQAESPSWTQAKLDAIHRFVKQHINEIKKYTIESATTHVSGPIWELEDRIDRLFNPRHYDPQEAERLA